MTLKFMITICLKLDMHDDTNYYKNLIVFVIVLEYKLETILSYQE